MAMDLEGSPKIILSIIDGHILGSNKNYSVHSTLVIARLYYHVRKRERGLIDEENSFPSVFSDCGEHANSTPVHTNGFREPSHPGKPR